MPETFRRKGVVHAMQWDPEDPEEFIAWILECGYTYRILAGLQHIEVGLPRGIYRTLGAGRWFMRTETGSASLISSAEMERSYERVEEPTT